MDPKVEIPEFFGGWGDGNNQKSAFFLNKPLSRLFHKTGFSYQSIPKGAGGNFYIKEKLCQIN